MNGIVALASMPIMGSRHGWHGTVERITRDESAPHGRRIETLATCSHYHRTGRLARECAVRLAEQFR